MKTTQPNDGAQPGPEAARRGRLLRRLRALLHVMPLADLRRGEGHREITHRHYDFLVLAIEAFDRIIDRASLEHESDADEIVTALRPLLHAMDAAANVAPDAERHLVVGHEVLAFLRRDADGRRKFEEKYSCWDGGGQTVERVVDFHLLREKFANDGRTVLQLSAEALNLFLNALDLDIEDAQAATKAVIQSQLARGKFRDAVATAEQARLQSMVFCEKIDAELRASRRDLRRVDWRHHVPNLLKDAEVHLDAQLLSERAILQVTQEQLELLDDDSLEAWNVAEVARLMRQCRQRHLALQQRLIGSRQVFFEQQDRQGFAPPPTFGRLDPLASVLEPLLRAGEESARRALERGTPALMGPQVPRALSLSALLAWHFRPRRELAVSREVLVAERSWERTGAETPRFSDEAWQRAEAFLSGVAPGERLSSALDRAGAAGESTEVQELVALLAVRAFAADDDEDDSDAGRRAELSGEKLATAGFSGDDLRLWMKRET